MATILVGLFDKEKDARGAIDDLTKMGVDRSRIDLTTGDASGITNRLNSARVPAQDLAIFAEGVRRGGTLLTATLDEDKAEKAEAILKRRGAIDVDERVTTWQKSGWKADTTAFARGREGEVALPVIEENIQVGKRQVQRGGMRVYTYVNEVPVEEDVRLREEHVKVDRRPADVPAPPAEPDLEPPWERPTL